MNYELKLLDMDRPNRNDKHELHNGEIVTMYNNRTYTEALEKYASTLEQQLTSTDVVKQSELLPDVEKKQLIEDAYWLNLQNLSGREDFEEAFKLGIETGVDETLEKLHS